ncbi:MAG: hypothetical protein ACFHU9_02760 [Fluviicola sp.]
MKLKFLNNTLQNRRFDYQPRYYDERKERLEKRKEQLRRAESGEMSPEERKQMLREAMRAESDRAGYRQSQRQSSNIRIFTLLLVLMGLFYFLFFGIDKVETIVERLW